MSPSERFLQLARECEAMSKFTHDAQNRPIWHRMAERWERCAEWAERQATAEREIRHRKRRSAH
jgi:hypothetical protein